MGSRTIKSRYLIDVVDQQTSQPHEIDRFLYHETACTGIWVLDIGVAKHGFLLLVVLRKDDVNDGVGRVSGGNERGCEHKIVSVSNANSRFCNRRTLDGGTPEGSAIGFDMGIVTDVMREIDGWRC